MKMKIVGLVLAGLMLAAGSSQAAMLQLVPLSGTPSVIPSDFNPVGFPGGLIAINDPITVYGSGEIGGLELVDGDATLVVEYLGSDAGFTNTFDFGTTSFSSASTGVGTTGTVDAVEGILPFTFATSGGGLSATNGLPIDLGVSIAFAALADGSFLALFNDGGGGDSDFDDLAVRISVSQVPLPAAAWLLISAILGLVSFSRIRRNGTQTA